MSYTTPRTWVAGELVTANLMNTHVRDNIVALKSLIDDLSTNLTLSDATYNDNSSHSLGNVFNQSGRIIVSTANGKTVIPFFPNGGGGVNYRWTGLDPDTGWTVNGSGLSFSFTDGSSSNTYTVTFTAGGGAASIQRTSGTDQYRVILLVNWQPA